MTYAIIENEVPSLNHIKEMIENLRPDWQLAFTSDSVDNTLQKIKDHGVPDLLFLDIELNDGNCFRIFDLLKDPVPVIFTTAYNEFCLKAFKVHSLDYLLKPITTEDLLFAIRKYEKLNEPRKLDSAVLSDLKTSADASSHSGRILIPSRDGYKFISTSDIRWIISDTKCVIVVDESGAQHITTFSSLNEIEELLPKKTFFRLSRAVITSIAAIEEVKKSFNYKLKVTLRASGTLYPVEVGAVKKKDFLNWFGSNKS